jgi:cell division GTPase FtsZ
MDDNKEREMAESLAAARDDKPTSPPDRAATTPPISARKLQPTTRSVPGDGRSKAESDVAGPSLHLAVVGSGQGGGRIANEFHRLGYKQAAVFNTTDQDFEGLSPELPRLSLHIGGAAKNMELAHNALVGRSGEAWELIETNCRRDADMALVCACLGGGTGSGTAPFLVDMLRGYVSSGRVGAVVSLPDPAEGYQVSRNAVLSFQQLVKMKVSPLIVLDNSKIRALYKVGAAKLFKTANEAVTELLHLFNMMSGRPSSYQSLDRAELLDVLDSGIVSMGSTSATPAELANDLSRDLAFELAENLLADLHATAKSAFLVIGGPEALQAMSADSFASTKAELIDVLTSPVLHTGMYESDSADVQYHVLTGGSELPEKAISVLARKGGLQGLGGQSRMSDYLGV